MVSCSLFLGNIIAVTINAAAIIISIITLTVVGTLNNTYMSTEVLFTTHSTSSFTTSFTIVSSLPTSVHGGKTETLRLGI